MDIEMLILSSDSIGVISGSTSEKAVDADMNL